MKRHVSISTTIALIISAVIITAAGSVAAFVAFAPGLIDGEGPISELLNRPLQARTLSSDSQGLDSLLYKVESIYRLIEQNYLFPIDHEKLADSIAMGMAAGLDDIYAAYFDADELNSFMTNSQGSMVGIGVEIISDPETGALRVETVYDYSPAHDAGIMVNDLIVKTGNLVITNENRDTAISMIRGEIDTVANITILRGDEYITMDIVRRLYEMQTVRYRMIGSNGYIRITNFRDTTVTQFKNAIDELLIQGATGFIFDMRNNGGGGLNPITEILEMLLPEGDIISASYNDGSTYVLARSSSAHLDMPMVTLTNGGTASAAELFVMALKDYGKAKSVGETTFGKGVMQSVYLIGDGSAIEFTTAFFNPPVSSNFNGVGIEPDYPVSLTKEQAAAFYTLDETNDPQLIKAIEVIEAEKSGR